MGGSIFAFLLWGLLPLLLALPCSPLFFGPFLFFWRAFFVRGPFLPFFFGGGKGGVWWPCFSFFHFFWGGGLFLPFYYNERWGGRRGPFFGPLSTHPSLGNFNSPLSGNSELLKATYSDWVGGGVWTELPHRKKGLSFRNGARKKVRKNGKLSANVCVCL